MPIHQTNNGIWMLSKFMFYMNHIHTTCIHTHHNLEIILTCEQGTLGLNDIHSKWTWHSNNLYFVQMFFTHIVFWVKQAKSLNYNQNQDHVLWQTFTKCSPFNFFLLYFNLMCMNILSTYTTFILRKPFFYAFTLGQGLLSNDYIIIDSH